MRLKLLILRNQKASAEGVVMSHFFFRCIHLIPHQRRFSTLTTLCIFFHAIHALHKTPILFFTVSWCCDDDDDDVQIVVLLWDKFIALYPHRASGKICLVSQEIWPSFKMALGPYFLGNFAPLRAILPWKYDPLLRNLG